MFSRGFPEYFSENGNDLATSDGFGVRLLSPERKVFVWAEGMWWVFEVLENLDRGSSAMRVGEGG